MKTTTSIITKNIGEHLQLYLLAAFCIVILLIRAKATQSVFFFFLVWNLFLAYTPLGITTLMRYKPTLAGRWYLLLPCFLCWLVLLPNAPYIITDFIHLKKDLNVPVWFDVLLIISFAITGLLFGLASMKEMFLILAKKRNAATAWIVLGTSCILSGFGVYVGRFLRYNSWDILHRPFSLMTDVLYSFTGTETWKPAIGITFGLGTFLFLLFRLYFSSNHNETINQQYYANTFGDKA